MGLMGTMIQRYKLEKKILDSRMKITPVIKGKQWSYFR